MNDIEVLTGVLSNVGFPIGAYVLMWYQHNTVLKELTKAMQSLKDVINCKKIRGGDIET